MSNTRQETAGDAALVRGARQLLMQTAELPEGESELLAVLSEYRRALHALVVGNGSADNQNADAQQR
ncbi:MAG TPA: hypothetical protein VII22_11970 [Streptosporangiaceae bacterium]